MSSKAITTLKKRVSMKRSIPTTVLHMITLVPRTTTATELA
jgi:hypothetical protein